jgi:hypothetical protein
LDSGCRWRIFSTLLGDLSHLLGDLRCEGTFVMAPPRMLLSLLGAALLAGRTSAKCNRPGCNTDACARAVRFDTTAIPSATRAADCSSFLAVTVTPSASWVHPVPVL